MNKCIICNHELQTIFTRKVLGKYDVAYYQCKNCQLIHTEKPYWLTEAYADSITKTDTGYVGRNILMSRASLVVFYFLFQKKDTFLDYAGGYGLLARLMNDYGLKFLWTDEYTQNIFARGLEYTHQKIAAITCFECFEHFSDPINECKKMLAISHTILFSTKLIPKNTVPNPDTWGYYGFLHGQHVTLYSEKSLRELAAKLEMNFYTDGKNIHLITDKKISNTLFKILCYLPKFQIDIILKICIR